MRKYVLAILVLVVSSASHAQNRATISEAVKNTRLNMFNKVDGSEFLSAQSPSVVAADPGDFEEEAIGDTKYDLQTNSSVCNRIVNHSSGISAVWTMSQAGGTYADRGTGYNFWDATQEGWGNQPTTRIENDRTGWPSVAVCADGSEHVISHNTNTNNLVLSSRPTAGSGNWTSTETILPPVVTDGNYWPRMVSGGADGNSLHVLSISYPIDPVTEEWIYYEGQAGAICYSRSSDSGSSFDVVHKVIDDIDSTFYFGFSSDDYAIDADGDNVAILLGGLSQGVTLLKSTDNGDSWVKTVVDTFPIAKFDYKTMISDINGDQIADTVECNDGSVSVLIDGQGTVHCFWGLTRMLDDVAAEAYSYFPGWDGLAYWNDSRGVDDVDTIAFALDLNGDGILNTPANGSTNFPFGVYGTGLTSHPSAGIDDEGAIYLAYSSVVDNSDDGEGRLLRHTYVMRSTDDGDSWSDPVDIYEDEFTECAFASIARKVDDCIHVLYQRDDQGGHALSQDSNGNPSDPGNDGGEIIYTCVPRTAVNIEEVDSSPLSGASVYPNPTANNARLNVTLTKGSQINVNVVDMMGRVVQEVTNTRLSNGNHSFDIDLRSVTDGVYFIRIQLNENIHSQKVVKL